jgi:predicted phage tail component-like protein
MNYTIWNGKDSREIKGLLISELPPITKPRIRTKETVIDGVDGSIIEELGYESYDKTIAIGLKIGADVDEITEYFTGSGEIIFSNEPNKYYRASIVNGIDYARLSRYRVAKVTFRVQPFKFENNEVELSNNGNGQELTVTNVGNYFSKPLITIKGTGTIVLRANGNWICDYTFPEGEDTVILDSEIEDAYFGDELKNGNMLGNFPILIKGTNTISWSGTVTKISVKRYSRWL